MECRDLRLSSPGRRRCRQSARELVRRKVVALQENGRLVRTPEGLFARMEHTPSDKARAAAVAMTTPFHRMIYDLKALDVRF